LITVAGTVIADFFARTLAGEPPRGFLTVIDEIGFHLGGAAPNTGRPGTAKRAGVAGRKNWK
jgi:hypothetical protein